MNLIDQCRLANAGHFHPIEDYQGRDPRWCVGCGDHTILTALLRLCRDEQLPPEKTVFVSGIGCSSRMPHYLKTYGFHGLHGRALPVAEGIAIRRPDLHVIVSTGDGDCCPGAGVCRASGSASPVCTPTTTCRRTRSRKSKPA